MRKKILSLLLIILSLMLSSCSPIKTELNYYYDEIKEEHKFDYSDVLFDYVIREGNEKIFQETDEAKKQEIINTYKAKLDQLVLSPEDKEIIIESFTNSVWYDKDNGAQITYYFGNYSGKHVYRMHMYDCNLAITKEINGYFFDSHKPGELFVTYEGETYHIISAYEDGLLSDEEIDDIFAKSEVVYEDICLKNKEALNKRTSELE